MKNIILQLEEAGKALIDLGHRGGHYGFKSGVVVGALFPELDYDEAEELDGNLPNKIGAFCNYLGGGIRGAVCGSASQSDLEAHGVKPEHAEKLAEFIELCKDRYIELEGDLNAEEYEDGDTNWDAIATNSARKAGVVSAY